MNIYANCICKGLLTLICALMPISVSADPEAEWRFRVLLDGNEIGHHHFLLDQGEEYDRLFSEASFEVKLLFVKLFEYHHRNEELWKGDCLASIDATTDSNGEPYLVKGWQADGQFTVQRSGGEASLPACVMTFAYWNPRFLGQRQLLNSQSGQFVDVSVAEPIEDPVMLDGVAVPARRYVLRTGEGDLLLWYSEQDDWLALETEARGGRTLRYERM